MAKVDGIVYKITEAQANCFKTAFGIFDSDGDGYVTAEEFVKLFRSVGQSPSEATLKEIIEKHDPEKTGKFDLHTFLQICDSPYFADPMKEERLVECFRMFDDDAIGKISISELRYVLQQIGEPLTDDEADKFIDWAMKAHADKNCRQQSRIIPLERQFGCCQAYCSLTAHWVPDAVSDGGMLNYDILARELMNRDPDVL